MADLQNIWTDASALLFDLDGVLTPTAVVHEQAWQELSSFRNAPAA
jgi:beta-phosphoglucomutase-like phosphatase (HAD superfamily)